ncbi:hypothetical protein ACYX7E_13940 [Luteimonas sp. RIT-PG2_3]
MPLDTLRRTLVSHGIDVSISTDSDVVLRASRLLEIAMNTMDDIDEILERNPVEGLTKPGAVRRPNDAETVRHIRIRMSRFRTGY